MIALIITLVLKVLFLGSTADVQPVIIPAKPSVAPTIHISEDVEWAEFHEDAMSEYMDMFDGIFNAVEYKRAKNGRSMVKGAYATSFKFAPKGK